MKRPPLIHCTPAQLAAVHARLKAELHAELPNILTVNDLAAQLYVHPSTIRRWVRDPRPWRSDAFDPLPRPWRRAPLRWRKPAVVRYFMTPPMESHASRTRRDPVKLVERLTPRP